MVGIFTNRSAVIKGIGEHFMVLDFLPILSRERTISIKNIFLRKPCNKRNRKAIVRISHVSLWAYMNILRKINPAIFLLIGSAIFWGLNFHLAKIMLQYVNFIEAGFWRYLLGVGFLLLLLLRSHSWPPISQIRIGMKGILLVGVVGLFGFNLFFLFGNEVYFCPQCRPHCKPQPGYDLALESLDTEKCHHPTAKKRV